MMSWRAGNLQAAIDGFKASGQLLVTRTSAGFGAADLGDDPGMYLFAAPLGAILGLDAVAAATVFLVGLIAVSFVIGSWGLWRAFTTLQGRVVGVTGLALLAYLSYRIGDVYMVSAAVLMGPIPWLWVATRTRSVRALLILSPVAGLAAGIANLVRGQAGTVALVVLITALGLATWAPARTRLLALSLLVIAALVAPAGLSLVHRDRDAFLATVDSAPSAAAGGHPIWHSIYIGLGYVANDHGIIYLDEVGFDFVKERDPEALSGSPESEAILRAEVLRLAAEDPAFIARGIGAKLLMILGYFVIFTNLGLAALFVVRPPLEETLPLFAGLLLAALPGILVIPLPDYLLGFIALCVLLGVVSIETWFASRVDQPTEPAGA